MSNIFLTSFNGFFDSIPFAKLFKTPPTGNAAPPAATDRKLAEGTNRQATEGKHSEAPSLVP